MSLGNDVVDLGDPETLLCGLHPRFAERVFTPRERAALRASPQRRRLHWALWAAKESAYKAQKRREALAVFSPGDYEVDLPPLTAASEPVVLTGRVSRRGTGMRVEVRVDGTTVHAIASAGNETAARALVLWRVGAAVGDAGVAVRRLAAGAIGSALDLDPAELQIVGRPPVVLHRGRALDATVSLSHHGRFVAFACRVGPPLLLTADDPFR